ncbi:MAG: metal ABC transporter permease [Acidimicrobiales bacterium]|nr:metal ABC transporter permease [Acidimicrobiales bacterium]
MTVLAEVAFQPDWWDVLQSDFMRNALIGGCIVAVAAGLLGYFVIVRQHAFAAHALAHIGFPGATGAVLIGVPVTLGLAVFTIGGALAIGLLGKRLTDREVSTGSILAFATGLGVLFNSLATKSANTVTNVLFGNLLAISDDELVTFGLITTGIVVVLAVIARPLTFASVNERVAEARRVPVRSLGVAFLILLALVITMAVQVVGTLLLFALVVTPAATALRFTARPAMAAALGTGIALFGVVGGLVLSTMFNLPPSFFVVSLVFVIWLVTLATVGRRRHDHAADRSRDEDVPGLA